MKTKAMRSQAGFTIYELVIVIAILSIIAVMAMGRAGSIVDKAYESSENSTIAAIQTGVTVQNAAEILPGH